MAMRPICVWNLLQIEQDLMLQSLVFREDEKGGRRGGRGEEGGGGT